MEGRIGGFFLFSLSLSCLVSALSHSRFSASFIDGKNGFLAQSLS